MVCVSGQCICVDEAILLQWEWAGWLANRTPQRIKGLRAPRGGLWLHSRVECRHLVIAGMVVAHASKPCCARPVLKEEGDDHRLAWQTLVGQSAKNGTHPKAWPTFSSYCCIRSTFM